MDLRRGKGEEVSGWACSRGAVVNSLEECTVYGACFIYGGDLVKECELAGHVAGEAVVNA